MNEHIAAMYNTLGAGEQVQEDLEKQAQAELFVKLAAENNIDLDQYNDEQVANLWQQTFGEKIAESDEEEPEKKKEEAKKELEEKKAEADTWEEKVAQHDYLGRLMAHAMYDEMGDIEKQAKGGAVSKALGRIGGAIKGEAAGTELGKSVTALKQLRAGGMSKEIAGQAKKLKISPEDMTSAVRSDLRRRGAKSVGRGVAAVGGLGGAGYLAGRASGGKEKKSSAIDELAVPVALQKAAEAGYDANEVDDRLSHIFSLQGVQESEKIAAASDVDTAVEIRALEFLELAGCQVDWNI